MVTVSPKLFLATISSVVSGHLEFFYSNRRGIKILQYQDQRQDSQNALSHIE